ncbi:serine/threonine-protein kinase [Streptomyces sp. DSM 41534]
MESLQATDPRQIGEYRLLGRLGKGGMGSVYLAQSPRGRTIAIKVVRSELAEQPDFRRRFEREVRAARQVGGEWTAPVLDADTDATQPWLATAFVLGIPLHEAVEERLERLPERTVRILGKRMALVLGSVYRAGLIHRDVKPSNILITVDGPQLIDFGIARALESGGDTQLTRTGAVVGSPAFMSPEQACGKRLTAASDIFSLGSALVFAATGRVPFGEEGLAAHAMRFRVAEDEADLKGVPDGLRERLGACLAKDPAARPGLADIVAHTADLEGEPGPDGHGNGAEEPWLPAGLVAQLGRHAAQLLEAEVPGAREAAERAAGADVIPPQLHDPPRTGFGPIPSDCVPAAEPSSSTPPGQSKRPGARRRAAVAGIVALALLAGGGIVLAVRAMVGSGGDDKNAGGTRPSPKESSLKPEIGGALPKEYPGTWQSTPKEPESEEAVMHYVEIRQGGPDDLVATTYSVRKDTLCQTMANLVSYATAS